MDRRRFLQSTVLTTAAAYVSGVAADDRSTQSQHLRAFNASLAPASNRAPKRRSRKTLRRILGLPSKT